MIIQEEDFEVNVIRKRDPETKTEINDGYPLDRDWNIRQKIKKAFKH